jgi:hypothetical protein
VCGVLLGSPAEDGANAVVVTDVVPMLHASAGRATPSVEIALEHAATHASVTGAGTLVGYYHGNELAGDETLGHGARKIADAVAAVARERGVDARALLISAEKLAAATANNADASIGPVAVAAFKRGGGGGWERVGDQEGALRVSAVARAGVARCHAAGVAAAIVDFDDHFDDVAADWRNVAADEAVERALTEIS